MIVYGSSLSPFVRKAMMFGAEKGIALELKPVAPGSTDPEFRAASPFGKMPAFRDGDFTVSDSSAIVAYLEAVKPEPGLIPIEPRARARTIWFDEFADTILGAAGTKIFFNRVVSKLIGRESDLAAADTAEAEEMPPLFAYLEGVLPESGHLIEDRLTLADIAAAQPLVNIAYCGTTVDADAYPRLARFMAAMRARPSLAALIAKDERFLARQKNNQHGK